MILFARDNPWKEKNGLRLAIPQVYDLIPPDVDDDHKHSYFWLQEEVTYRRTHHAAPASSISSTCFTYYNERYPRKSTGTLCMLYYSFPRHLISSSVMDIHCESKLYWEVYSLHTNDVSFHPLVVCIYFHREIIQYSSTTDVACSK